MCGICGTVGIDDKELIREMTRRIAHRGPDDCGYYQADPVNFGHRRLSIIDLAGGAQPMSNESDTLTMVFNGEIYNYLELRQWLESRGHQCRTSSDTEVLLRLYELEGVAALSRLNGMFALAIHDRQRDELFLARDRLGIKPLYYLDLQGRFLFASEMKALLCYREWAPEINPAAIHDYLALRYVPGEKSIFSNVRRLPAGHYLTYRPEQTKIEPYWQPPFYDGPYHKSDEAYLEELDSLLRQSVKRRLISDVPFGAYLSGGLDSSIIVALMSQFATEPIKTFSVGFDYAHDELSQAAETAALLGCDHQSIACRAEDMAKLPQVVFHMDEPQGDPIMLPMYLLSREAKRKVTVILTGEGGDEIFGGYLFHRLMWLGEQYRRLVPKVVREKMVMPLAAQTPAAIMNLAFQYPAYLGQRGKQKALDYLQLMEPDQIDLAYRHLISLYDRRDFDALYTNAFKQNLANNLPKANGLISDPGIKDGTYLNRLLHLQFAHWLPDNMLMRQDKMGMAHSIEGRVPFLDHELVEFALRLPPRLKVRPLQGKFILRQFAKKILPSQVTRRKKMPFYVPIENYFAQPDFQAMMHDLLSDASIKARGLFQPAAVARLRHSMKQREFVLVKQVFSLMVLELWFRTFVDSR